MGPCRQDQETARILRRFSICPSTINSAIHRGTVAVKAAFSIHALAFLVVLLFAFLAWNIAENDFQ